MQRSAQPTISEGLSFSQATIDPGKPGVLIVAPEFAAAQDLCNAFLSLGFRRVDTANNVRDALRCIGRAMPGIAIVDISVKDGKAGAQLAAALSRSGVRVCVLSGQGEREAALMSVPHVFVCKPLPSHVVADFMADAMSAHATPRDRLH